MGQPARKRTQHAAIQDVQDLTKAVRRIGELGRGIATIRQEMEAAVAAASAPFLKRIENRRTQLDVLDADAAQYCTSHRDELLAGASGKTCQLATGKILFKNTRDKVVLEMDEALVVARLHDAVYPGAIRVRSSVDKQYVLSHPEIAERIDGLIIEPGREAVVIKPTTIS